MIGSKNEVSTPGIDCPGTSATLDRPVERTLTWLMPVSAGWIETFTSWRSFLTSAGRQRDPHPRTEHPLDLDQVDVDDVAGVEAGDPHRAADADALGVAEDDVDRPVRRQEAGPVAGHG